MHFLKNGDTIDTFFSAGTKLTHSYQNGYHNLKKILTASKENNIGNLYLSNNIIGKQRKKIKTNINRKGCD